MTKKLEQIIIKAKTKLNLIREELFDEIIESDVSIMEKFKLIEREKLATIAQNNDLLPNVISKEWEEEAILDVLNKMNQPTCEQHKVKHTWATYNDKGKGELVYFSDIVEFLNKNFEPEEVIVAHSKIAKISHGEYKKGYARKKVSVIIEAMLAYVKINKVIGFYNYWNEPTY